MAGGSATTRQSPDARPAAAVGDDLGLGQSGRPPDDGADGRKADETRSFWRRNRRRTITAVVGLLATIGFFYFALPRLVGLGPTLRALRSGDTGWLLLGVALEACSMLGDVVTFHGVFAARGARIGWRRTADVRMAGAAATKLLAAAGAGGIALAVWALRASELSGADVAEGMVCYEILTYGVYAIALAGAGFGLWFGVFSGPHPVGLTLIPAALATAVIVVVLSMLFVYERVERLLQRRAGRWKGRAAERWGRVATLPRTLHTGLVAAVGMVKRRDPSTLGAFAYWGFDIGALWASFHAFGNPPPIAVMVTGYYLGTLGSALPLPGGIGGVEGGMIGAFLGFGIKAPLATVAVLGYRTISYWLPTVPGVIAYFHLRHNLGNRVEAGNRPGEAAGTLSVNRARRRHASAGPANHADPMTTAHAARRDAPRMAEAPTADSATRDERETETDPPSDRRRPVSERRGGRSPLSESPGLWWQAGGASFGKSTSDAARGRSRRGVLGRLPLGGRVKSGKTHDDHSPLRRGSLSA